jgi:hypothetical protein
MNQFGQFTYQDYFNNSQQTSQASTQQAQKVGFFKLKDDGDEALVRINLGSVEELQFAAVHTINAAGKWMKVSCLSPFGTGSCPLCSASANGNSSISKASKKVYVQMMVAYRDKTTGAFSAAVPVVWERPAGFSKELANKLRDYGNLREVLLKVTRNGVAGDMKTTYSMDYAVPTVFKPELVPTDFSAFANFNIAKHSYWEKTPEEIMAFLQTGSFPEAAKPAPAPAQAPVMAAAPTYTAPVQPAYTAPAQPAYQAPVQPAAPAYQAPVAPAQPAVPNPNIPQGAVNTPQQPAANSGNGAPKNFGWTF